jgi:hypothetical protein
VQTANCNAGLDVGIDGSDADVADAGDAELD